MRDLAELGLEWSGSPFPTADVQALEAHFSVSLPSDYLCFLSLVNGGVPKNYCFNYIHKDGELGEVTVGDLYRMTDDHEDLGGIWKNTVALREYLAEAGLSTDVIAVGRDGSIMPIYLDMSAVPVSVHILYVDDNYLDFEIADSFERFIDGLTVWSEDYS
ncbi:MAG: SMI1/KNR4 family protein [Janthinobacterium lividum]